MSGRAYYIFNVITAHERAAERLRAGTWAVDAQESQSSALAAGDLVLVYLAAPERAFIGRAELASPVRDSAGGVLLSRVEEWDPPVPMDAVLAQIASETAKGDFDAAVVRISEHEYETAVAVAAATSP